MNTVLLTAAVASLLLAVGCTTTVCSAAQGDEPMLAHNVYFTLTEDSPEAREALVAACHRYLKDHPGVVFFAAGTLAEDLAREVNVRDFQVGLHVVFKTRKHHDDYQIAENHLEFIKNCKHLWKGVRVFDTLVR